MKKSILLFLLLITANAFSQDTIKTLKKSDLEPNQFNDQRKWEYFQLEDTIVVKIIDHKPAFAFCGILATASMSIVETEKGDTIRVIDLCNTLDIYKKGQTLKVIPEDKPTFGVSLPFTFGQNTETTEFEYTGFDITVVRTTFGGLLVEY
jgi:hypothetical protein